MSGDERDLKDTVPAEEQVPRPESSSSSVISRTSSPEHLQDDLFVHAEKQEDQLDPEKVSADVAARGIVNPKKLGSVAQTGMRGMLIAACEVETNDSEKTEGTDEGALLSQNEHLDKDTGMPVTENHDPMVQEIHFFNKDSSTSRPSSASSSSSIAVGTNQREVSFQAGEHGPLLNKERSFISRTGNSTVEVVSISTQTEWSWLKDMELYQEMTNRSKPEWAERTERKTSKEGPKSPSGND